MSEETTTPNAFDEAVKLVEVAQSKKVFNLADAIKGRSYPTKEVVVYLDEETAMLLDEVNDDLDYVTDVEELDRLTAKAEQLRSKVLQSAIIFKLRGVSQAMVEAAMDATNKALNIGKKEDVSENAEWMRHYITRLISTNIVSVRDASGAEDLEPFTFERAEELRLNIAQSEWAKLMEAMQQLTLAGGYFDQVTDAGFLQKS